MLFAPFSTFFSTSDGFSRASGAELEVLADKQ